MASARGSSPCHSRACVISPQISSFLLTFAGPGPSTSSDPFTTKRFGGNVDQGINWLTQCLAEHPACVPKPDTKEPPRRLIFVGSGDVDAVPRLVETTTCHKDLRYMTLSHCWGKQPIITLKTDNYATMLQRIPLSHLQQVFRDAISMTQKAE